MLKLKQGIALVAVGSLAFVAGRMLPAGDAAIAAQPTKDAKDSKATQPAKDATGKQPAGMPPMPKPGAEHKNLQTFVGEWTMTGKMWMQPGSEPESFGGKVSRKWTLDNWFVVEDVIGDPSPVPEIPAYKALGLMGYNQAESKYETAWADNMSGYIATMTGTYDAAKKLYTFTGETIDPTTQKRTKHRMTVDVSQADTHVMTGYGHDASGKEYKNFEGTCKRTAGTGK